MFSTTSLTINRKALLPLIYKLSELVTAELRLVSVTVSSGMPFIENNYFDYFITFAVVIQFNYVWKIRKIIDRKINVIVSSEYIDANSFPKRFVDFRGVSVTR